MESSFQLGYKCPLHWKVESFCLYIKRLQHQSSDGYVVTIAMTGITMVTIGTPAGSTPVDAILYGHQRSRKSGAVRGGARVSSAGGALLLKTHQNIPAKKRYNNGSLSSFIVTPLSLSQITRRSKDIQHQ